MMYDSFKETGAGALNTEIESKRYTSILPKVGVRARIDFGKAEIFAGAEYAYEMGDLNKNQKFTYESFNGMGELASDNLEKEKAELSVGVNYELNSLVISASVGQTFTETNDIFGRVAFGYRF